MPSPKQSAIIAFCRTSAEITLEQATALVGRNVYHNADKHTGAILSNMVKQGMLVRIKPGLFRLATREDRIAGDGPRTLGEGELL